LPARATGHGHVGVRWGFAPCWRAADDWSAIHWDGRIGAGDMGCGSVYEAGDFRLMVMVLKALAVEGLGRVWSPCCKGFVCFWPP